MTRVLLIDDDTDFSPELVEALRTHGHDVRWLSSPEEGLDLLTREAAAFDVVLLDYIMGTMNGDEFLEKRHQRGIKVLVVLLTHFGNADIAIRAAKLGAFRYEPKPDDLTDRSLAPLLRLLAEATETARCRAQAVDLEAPGEDELLNSAPMRGVFQQIGHAAGHGRPVLITGEPGTGKDLVARAIHRHSGRSGELIRVNCFVSPDDRLEDELFGCEPGAYPGVDRPCPGVFEQADGGTVLLDHFNVPGLSIQLRICRLIKEGVVQRVGRGAPRRAVSVRVLACSSHDLPAALQAGRLHPELYSLLTDTTIALPPLRERGDDVLVLADQFLRQAAAALRPPVQSFHPLARERLRRHDWRDNVRELRLVVRRAVQKCSGAEIGPNDLLLAPPRDLREGRQLPPSRKKAYDLYWWALEVNPTLENGKDEDVFRWLRRSSRAEEEGLPDSCETFSRYLRQARKHYEECKHDPLGGRSDSA